MIKENFKALVTILLNNFVIFKAHYFMLKKDSIDLIRFFNKLYPQFIVICHPNTISFVKIIFEKSHWLLENFKLIRIVSDDDFYSIRAEPKIFNVEYSMSVESQAWDISIILIIVDLYRCIVSWCACWVPFYIPMLLVLIHVIYSH